MLFYLQPGIFCIIFTAKYNYDNIATVKPLFHNTFVPKKTIGNNLQNNEKLPTLLDMALSYEDGNQGEIKPKTRVVVNTNRIWYGENSTASAFLATAYDEQGGKIDSLKGYFLEPHVNYDSAKVANSDKAIMYGAYNIIPKEELEKRINKERRERGEKDIQLTYKWGM